MKMRSRFQANVTMVANEFIDHYMAAANGEYVKVYLYILRHQDEKITVEKIADALNHTEADVKRALAFWEKAGALLSEEVSEGNPMTEPSVVRGQAGREEAAAFLERSSGTGSETGRSKPQTAGAVQSLGSSRMSVASVGQTGASGQAASPGQAISTGQTLAGHTSSTGQRKSCTSGQMERLAGEEDFAQLLYIAQKFMSKVFTPKECEVFAYLYDTLHMPAELLEYLAEYCAQTGHSSIRYLETVALNWHERKILTVEKAKAYTASYTKDGFAVMRAFGLGERRPAEVEKEMMEKWFREYGFTREIVIEACNRTMAAIHNPSFQYADKILSEWRKAGVRHLDDIRVLDERRKQTESGSKAPQAQTKNSRNQFHNFEQRNTNYDAMVLERLKERLGE